PEDDEARELSCRLGLPYRAADRHRIAEFGRIFGEGIAPRNVGVRCAADVIPEADSIFEILRPIETDGDERHWASTGRRLQYANSLNTGSTLLCQRPLKRASLSSAGERPLAAIWSRISRKRVSSRSFASGMARRLRPARAMASTSLARSCTLRLR